jgi:hypothetical protein
MFDLPSCLTPNPLITAFSGPKNPRARNTSWAGKNLADPGTSSIFHLPALSLVHSTRTTTIDQRPFTIVPIKFPSHTCFQTLQFALIIHHELLGRNTVLPRVRTKVSSDLSVTIVGPEDPRPLRPRVIRRTAGRRLWQKLKVHDRFGSMSHRGSDTVVSGVTTSNDDNVLALRADVVSVLKLGIQQRFGVVLQELHSEVDTVGVAVWQPEVSWPGRASTDDQSITLSPQFLDIDINTNVRVGHERLSK